jgi:hypothetical protein
MSGFFDHIPAAGVPALREAIQAVTETKVLLDQVAARFGTTKPKALRKMIGRTVDGIAVSEESVAQLEHLLRLHEERRTACRLLMESIAAGEVP